MHFVCMRVRVCGCVRACGGERGLGRGGGGHCNCVIQFGESASILRCSDLTVSFVPCRIVYHVYMYFAFLV